MSDQQGYRMSMSLICDDASRAIYGRFCRGGNTLAYRLPKYP
jgi:hypothetical protein